MKRLKNININSRGKNTPQSAVPSDSFFSENGHPFVCFADISPIRGITSIKRREPKKAVKLYYKNKVLFSILKDCKFNKAIYPGN